MHTATSILPNQSSTSCCSSVSLARTCSSVLHTPYSVPAPAMPRRLISSSEGPKVVLCSCIRTHRTDLTDAGALEHTPELGHGHAHVLVRRFFCRSLSSMLPSINRMLWVRPNTKDIISSTGAFRNQASPRRPRAPGDNLRNQKDMWQTRHQTMNFDDEQHPKCLTGRGHGCHWPPPSSVRDPIQ